MNQSLKSARTYLLKDSQNTLFDPVRNKPNEIMFLEIIFISLMLIGLSGISMILLKKIPALIELQDAAPPGDSMASKLKKEMRKIPGVKKLDLDYELYLQKMLSKVRVLTLKTENKTGSWLERLRKRRNGHNHDYGYWEELKKTKDDK